MNVKTYRAKTMQEALALVRRELGPEAAVLHTREVRGGGLLRLARRPAADRGRGLGQRHGAQPVAASRAAEPTATPLACRPNTPCTPQLAQRAANRRSRQTSDRQIRSACRRWSRSSAAVADRRRGRETCPKRLFRLFTDLIEADVSEDLARELVERVRQRAPRDELADAGAAQGAAGAR